MPERRTWSSRLLVREMWAAVAVAFVWLAVLFAAIFGPDIESTSAGINATTVPSVVVIAPFAMLATWPIAKYGFARQGDDTD